MRENKIKAFPVRLLTFLLLLAVLFTANAATMQIFRDENGVTATHRDSFIVKVHFDDYDEAKLTTGNDRWYNSRAGNGANDAASLAVSLEEGLDNVYGESGQSLKLGYDFSKNTTVKNEVLMRYQGYIWNKDAKAADLDPAKSSFAFWVKASQPVKMYVRSTGTTAIQTPAFTIPAGESVVELPLMEWEITGAPTYAALSQPYFYIQKAEGSEDTGTLYIDHVGMYPHGAFIDTAVTGHGETGDPVYGGTVDAGGHVYAGSDESISITPDSGWHISTITVDGTGIDPAGLDFPDLTLDKANSYTFENIQADHTIEVTFEKIFAVLKGASIRLSDEAALRFVTVVSSQFLADLDSKGADYSMGTLIIPRNLIASGSDLARDTGKVKDITRTMWQDDFFGHPEGYRVMTGVLNGIPSANYSRALAGRAYITFGGDTIYTDFEEASNVRSLAQVAHSAYNDPEMQPLENYYTAAQIAKLTAYADAYILD